MELAVGDVVLPGETLDSIMNAASDKNKIILGNGLRFGGISSTRFWFFMKLFRCNINAEESFTPTVTKGGMLCRRKPNIYYVDSYQKRYIPAKNDSVIGVVQTKTMDLFWVDINSSEPAG